MTMLSAFKYISAKAKALDSRDSFRANCSNRYRMLKAISIDPLFNLIHIKLHGNGFLGDTFMKFGAIESSVK